MTGLYIFGVSHRLELTLKDVLKGTPFDDIDEMLLQMYYLYEYPPKKFRELQEIYDKYKDILEFDEGGLKPLRASGTRWITYKVEAMKLVLDKYGLFINHLKQMSVDRSYTSTDRAKFIGWLRKWQDARYPLLTCLFIEVLSPSKVLSLAFQEEDTDIVSVVAAIEKTKKQLKRLADKSFEELPMVKSFLGKIVSSEEGHQYEDIFFKKIELSMKNVSSIKCQMVGLIRDHLISRLQNDEISVLKSASIILDSKGWDRDDETLGDEEIHDLYKHFETPLKNAGVNCTTVDDVIEEWHNLIEYTTTYLNRSTLSHKRVWYKLFNSIGKSRWSNILLLIELLFCLRISNVTVERLFSLMKCLKTSIRSSLGQTRLSNIIRIKLHGPSLSEFDPTAAIDVVQKVYTPYV